MLNSQIRANSLVSAGSFPDAAPRLMSSTGDTMSHVIVKSNPGIPSSAPHQDSGCGRHLPDLPKSRCWSRINYFAGAPKGLKTSADPRVFGQLIESEAPDVVMVGVRRISHDPFEEILHGDKKDLAESCQIDQKEPAEHQRQTPARATYCHEAFAHHQYERQ